MINLKDPKISYLLISESNGIDSYLYSRNYYILEISEYYKGDFGKSILAFSNVDNNELRKDSIHIMENFGIDNVIVKYLDDDSPKRVYNSGDELPLGVIIYNTDSDKKSYIYEGVSFSFIEQQLYYFPNKMEDFKTGMVVEFLNNNKWIEKRVKDPESEYNNLYQLLIKYNKIRIPV
jgi:hypothetical protein